MRYEEDERVTICQREIQRLHQVCREYREELTRYKEIAYTAFSFLAFVEGCDPYGDYFRQVMEELGVTDEEYKEIMEEPE